MPPAPRGDAHPVTPAKTKRLIIVGRDLRATPCGPRCCLRGDVYHEFCSCGRAACEECHGALRFLAPKIVNESRARLPEPVVWRFEAGEQLRLIETLTEREMEVLRLVAEGLSNKEIGATLHVCWRTVRTHVSNILLKLQARNRTDVVRIALQVGLIQLGEPTSAQAAFALSAYYATLAQKLLQEGRR